MSMINWVKSLYNNSPCKVINNGDISQTLYFQSGMKKGCPLSFIPIHFAYRNVRIENKIQK